MRIFVTSLCTIMVTIFIMEVPAISANQSAWQDHQGMISTRILVASPDIAQLFPTRVSNGEDTVLLAWEAKLTDGWKTYWRSPGEAGLPVRLFANDNQIELLYPFPERFELFGLETYGYSKQVVIPFQVKASDVAGSLDLKADFMVCKDICVPFEASYNLAVDIENAGDITSDIRVQSWLAKVPEVGDAAPGGLVIDSVRLAGTPGHQNLIVDATAAAPLTKADVLAEANESMQFRSPKVRLRRDGRSARFVLPVVSAQSNYDLSQGKVRVTLTDGRGNAIDRFFDLSGR
ncbi:protein-disulfide reductase DsbD domain-containing protein [Kordiimonas aquimaris]|uniref:protein-disulfide reductase DsbD domain-containing protein n=1 Tax=Kordiimonas aquimaris TaxID=707591 RepID=UPI0021D222B5|nr:protein-disulfide reductase DsbD domain-containing protein [Kordiimonas aquimaris]